MDVIKTADHIIDLGPEGGDEGGKLPIKIIIKLANSAGIFQVDEMLRRKLATSTIQDYVEIVVKIDGPTERSILKIDKP